MPVADEAWSRTRAAAVSLRAASPRAVVVAGTEADSAAVPLVLRLTRDRDPSLPGRVAASAVLLAAVAVIRLAARRRGAWLSRGVELLPVAAVPAGLAWMAWLVPVWPGAAIMAVGVIAIVSGWLAWLRPRGVAFRRPAGGGDKGDIVIATTEFAPVLPAAGYSSGGSSPRSLGRA